MRVSEKTLNECNTLEDLVDVMTTDNNGNKIILSEVGETNDFIKRYEHFKEYLSKEIPDLTLDEMLFIMDNQRKVTDVICGWYGYNILLTALEFEKRKNIL